MCRRNEKQKPGKSGRGSVMRSIRTRLAQLGLSVVAAIGLAACTDPAVNSAWDSMVSAMRDANAANHNPQPAHAAATPAAASTARTQAKPTAATGPAAPAASASVPPVAPTAAHSPAPAAHTTPELAAMQRQLDDL